MRALTKITVSILILMGCSCQETKDKKQQENVDNSMVLKNALENIEHQSAEDINTQPNIVKEEADLRQEPWDTVMNNFNRLISQKPLNPEFLQSIKAKPYWVSGLQDSSEIAVLGQIVGDNFRPLHNLKQGEENIDFYLQLKNLERESWPVSDEAFKKLKNRGKRYDYAFSTFKKKAKKAKDEFYKKNLTLQFDEDLENTYLSERKEAVYLPFGKISFADEVLTYKNDMPEYNPEMALKEPDRFEGLRPTHLNNVYSLGLKGEVTFRFTDNAIVDVEGPDIYVFEVGEIEPTKLEISKEGTEWIDVGQIDGGTAMVDIHDFVKPDELFYYLRFTDLETKSGIPGADIDAVAAIGAAMKLQLDSRVLFETGKSELKESAQSVMSELVNNFSKLKQGTILVEGHTDDVGEDDYNQQLSISRAQSVANAIEKLLGKHKFKIKVKGYGESKPAVPNDSEENRTKNRRVEIIVSPH